MNSIWTDLLFLHGHLVRKEDLLWRAKTTPEPGQQDVVSTRTAPTPAAPSRDGGNPACA